MSEKALNIFDKIDLENTSINDYKVDLFDELENLEVTNMNIVELTEIAIKQFDYLLQNENLSGYYFVDWRIAFSQLEEYTKTNKTLIKENISIIEFLICYNVSSEILYDRLDI